MSIYYEAPPGTYTIRFTADGQSTPTATTYTLTEYLVSAASTLYLLDDQDINEPDGNYTFVVFDSGVATKGITTYRLLNGVEYVETVSVDSSAIAQAVGAEINTTLTGIALDAEEARQAATNNQSFNINTAAVTVFGDDGTTPEFKLVYRDSQGQPSINNAVYRTKESP